ncbi:UNVERIFIED_CONTAM: hypothetical protein HDU68_004054 [Siphonaria sp. JEL0065]|nr:hypothetical protein HDU68_004054 [Siphonaria sp. JEL0065]
MPTPTALQDSEPHKNADAAIPISLETDSSAVPNGLPLSNEAGGQEETKPEEQTETVPDGGAVAVGTVVASLISHVVLFGVVYSYGVYNAHYQDIGVGSPFQVALIGSCSTVFIPGLGVLSGKAAAHFGFRQMILVGSIILSTGLFLASFTTNLILLILTQGVVFGVGCSLVYFPVLSLPSQWFLKRRALAVGIAVSGTGIGGLIFSVSTDRMLNTVGLEWTLRATSITALVLLLAINPLCKTRIPASTSKIDFSVVKDTRFILLLFSCMFSNFAMFVSVDFLPIYARERGNLTLHDGANLVAIYNICSTCGRILMGLASDSFLGPTNSLVVSMWITAVANFAWLACTDFPSLACFSAFNGLFGGAVWGLLPVVIAGMFGSTGKLVSLIACLYSVLAIGNFFSPITTSTVEEAYGLEWMAIYAGVIATMAALFGTASRLVHDSKVFVKV